VVDAPSVVALLDETFTVEAASEKVLIMEVIIAKVY